MSSSSSRPFPFAPSSSVRRDYRDSSIIRYMTQREIGKEMSNKKLYLGKLKKRPIQLSTLFPSIGSLQTVVLLGFTQDGEYLVSIDGSSIRFHSFPQLQLSLKLESQPHFKLSDNRIEVLRNGNCSDLAAIIVYSNEFTDEQPLANLYVLIWHYIIWLHQVIEYSQVLLSRRGASP